MATLFSTESLAQHHRFDFWHDVVCKVYAPCQGVVSDRTAFSARTEVFDFGATKVSHVTSTGTHYDRRSSDLRQNPQDDIFISLMIDGEGRFEQNGRQARQSRGDVLIYDSGKPYSYHYEDQYSALLLRIPRALMQSRLTDMDTLGGTVLSGRSPFGGLIGSMLQESSRIVSLDALSDSSMFCVPTLDMIAAAILRATGDTFGNTTRQQNLLERIKHYMKAHLADDEMTLERISEQQNVSVRTLSRLFSDAGETPRGWLQAQRLAGAYDALVHRKVRNVTEAAFSFGFRDLSHFSRAFKKAYGCSPNSVLNRSAKG